ncbi:hypothetical protein D3C80_308770 [compost metagenome]
MTRFLRAFGGVLHRDGDFFQRRRSLFNGRRLLFGTSRQIICRRPDFVGAGIDAAGILRHLGKGRL